MNAYELAYAQGQLEAVMRCFGAAMKANADKAVLEAILAELNAKPAQEKAA